MKILFYGNQGNTCFRLAKYLQAKGHEVKLYLPSNYRHVRSLPEHEDLTLKDNYPNWIHTYTHFTENNIKPPEIIINEAKKHDVLVVSGSNIISALDIDIPIVFFPVGYDITELPFRCNNKVEERLSLIYRKKIHNVSRIITVQRISLYSAILLGCRDKLRIFPLPTDYNSLHHNIDKKIKDSIESVYSAYDYVFLNLSRKNLNFKDIAYKGTDKFIKAIYNITKDKEFKEKKFKIILGMHGYSVNLCKQLIQNYNLERLVDYIDHLPLAQLHAYLSLSNGIVFDQFGQIQNVIAGVARETLTLGNILVTSTDTSLYEHKKAYGPDCPLFYAYETEEIEAHMRKILSMDKSELDSIRNQSKAWAYKYLHWENRIDEFIEILQEAIDEWKSKRAGTTQVGDEISQPEAQISGKVKVELPFEPESLGAVEDQAMWAVKVLDSSIYIQPDAKWLTSFVLLEQRQWFDIEYSVVQKLVGYNQKSCLDIGAGFGVYALHMASKVCKQGTVYVFEPGSVAQKHLEKSRGTNKLNNLEILPQALSDNNDSGRLHLASTPEFNSLHPGAGQESEDIELITLGKWWVEKGRPEIGLVKIDVNGHEPMVIQGGREFFLEASPVVMLAVGSPDLKPNKDRQRATLLSQKLFQSMGYSLYRLVPGPNVLVPYKEADSSPYLLNLFACKPDTAEQMKKDELLVSDLPSLPVLDSTIWKKYLLKTAYAEKIFPHLNKIKPGSTNKHLNALNLLCAAQTDKFSASQKVAVLEESARIFSEIYDSGKSSGSLCFCLARTLHDLGHRDKAVNVLENLVAKLQDGKKVGFDKPFLPPLSRFEDLVVKNSPQNWLMARCLESLLFLRNFSSYFFAQKDITLLDTLCNNPEHSDETTRRAKLIKKLHDK